MKELDYSVFKESYEKLSKEHQFIIFQLLQNLEHKEDDLTKKINYKRGFQIAMEEHTLSIEALAKILEDKAGISEQRNTIASMITRGSKNSGYFKDTLDLLEINENFLIGNSEYIQSKIGDMEWCFETLSNKNKEAVYFLTLQLSNMKNITNFIEYIKNPYEIKNVGIESDNE